VVREAILEISDLFNDMRNSVEELDVRKTENIVEREHIKSALACIIRAAIEEKWGPTVIAQTAKFPAPTSHVRKLRVPVIKSGSGQKSNLAVNSCDIGMERVSAPVDCNSGGTDLNCTVLCARAVKSVTRLRLPSD
jgi:hypothetical protein